MRLTRRAVTAGGLGLLATGGFAGGGRAWDGPIVDLVEGAEDFGIASEAYVYGYPLVTMEMTRRVITNVAKPEGTRAPMGHAHQDARLSGRELPRRHRAERRHALHHRLLRRRRRALGARASPTWGTATSCCRMLDGWTNVFAGARASGRPATGRRPTSITGPGWAGEVPEGMTELKSPTSIVWMLGRIYCTGHAGGLRGGPCAAGRVQAPAAQRLGQGLRAAGGQGRSGDRHEDGGARAGQRAGRRRTIFTLLAELMKRNPPAAADAPMLERFAQIGIVPGEDFDAASSIDALRQAAAGALLRPDHAALQVQRRRHQAR